MIGDQRLGSLDKLEMTSGACAKMTSGACAETTNNCFKNSFFFGGTRMGIYFKVKNGNDENICQNQANKSFTCGSEKIEYSVDNGKLKLSIDGQTSELALGGKNPDKEDIFIEVDPGSNLAKFIKKSDLSGLGTGQWVQHPVRINAYGILARVNNPYAVTPGVNPAATLEPPNCAALSSVKEIKECLDKHYKIEDAKAQPTPETKSFFTQPDSVLTLNYAALFGDINSVFHIGPTAQVLIPFANQEALGAAGLVGASMCLGKADWPYLWGCFDINIGGGRQEGVSYFAHSNRLSLEIFPGGTKWPGLGITANLDTKTVDGELAQRNFGVGGEFIWRFGKKPSSTVAQYDKLRRENQAQLSIASGRFLELGLSFDSNMADFKNLTAEHQISSAEQTARATLEKIKATYQDILYYSQQCNETPEYTLEGNTLEAEIQAEIASTTARLRKPTNPQPNPVEVKQASDKADNLLSTTRGVLQNLKDEAEPLLKGSNIASLQAEYSKVEGEKERLKTELKTAWDELINQYGKKTGFEFVNQKYESYLDVLVEFTGLMEHLKNRIKLLQGPTTSPADSEAQKLQNAITRSEAIAQEIKTEVAALATESEQVLAKNDKAELLSFMKRAEATRLHLASTKLRLISVYFTNYADNKKIETAFNTANDQLKQIPKFIAACQDKLNAPVIPGPQPTTKIRNPEKSIEELEQTLGNGLTDNWAGETIKAIKMINANNVGKGIMILTNPTHPAKFSEKLATLLATTKYDISISTINHTSVTNNAYDKLGTLGKGGTNLTTNQARIGNGILYVIVPRDTDDHHYETSKSYLQTVSELQNIKQIVDSMDPQGKIKSLTTTPEPEAPDEDVVNISPQQMITDLTQAFKKATGVLKGLIYPYPKQIVKEIRDGRTYSVSKAFNGNPVMWEKNTFLFSFWTHLNHKNHSNKAAEKMDALVKMLDEKSPGTEKIVLVVYQASDQADEPQLQASTKRFADQLNALLQANVKLKDVNIEVIPVGSKGLVNFAEAGMAAGDAGVYSEAVQVLMIRNEDDPGVKAVLEKLEKARVK